MNCSHHSTPLLSLSFLDLFPLSTIARQLIAGVRGGAAGSGVQLRGYRRQCGGARC
jgi:hypothetical protein